MSYVSAELPAVYLDALLEDAASFVSGVQPVLINLDPEVDEVAVTRATNIAFDLATLGELGQVDTFATRVYVNGALAFDAGVFKPGFDGAGSRLTNPQSDVLRVVIDPTTSFDSESIVSVRVVSRAIGDAAELDQSYQFTIEDYEGPRVTAAAATFLTRVRVEFNELIDKATALDASQWALSRLGDYVTPLVHASIVSVEDAPGSAVDLVTDIPMTPRGTYQVSVTGVADTSGNEIDPSFGIALFEGWVPPSPAGRSFDLYGKIPDHNKSADVTLDLLRFVGCIQEIADLLLYDIDQFVEILDPDSAPEDAVDAMLQDLGNPFAFELTLADKRRLANVLVAMYQLKGTGVGIANVVRFFLGVELEVRAHNTMSDAWRLGESLLGDTTTLGPSAVSDLYSFELVSPEVLAAETRARVVDIATYMKPAHTHLARLIEPTPAEVVSEFLPLGIAQLGFSWRLGQSASPQVISPPGVYTGEYFGALSLLLPVITAVSKTSADPLGGETVVITGRNLSSLLRVAWHDVTCTVTANTSTSITITTPNLGATVFGAFELQVTTSYGSVGTTLEAWVPRALSGSALWLRADLGVSVNGSTEVTAWADQSGIVDAGRVWTPPGTDKPAFVATNASYNNRPTIGTFNKAGVANDCRLRSGTWNATYTSPTIIIVGHTPGAGGNRYFTHEQNSDYLGIVGNPTSQNVRAYSGTADTFLSANAVNPAVPRVIIAEYNGAASKLFVDSFTSATASGSLDATTLGDAPLYLGSYPLGAMVYGVEAIAEVIVDSRPFSTWPVADVRKLGAYLNSRYGKAIALP